MADWRLASAWEHKSEHRRIRVLKKQKKRDRREKKKSQRAGVRDGTRKGLTLGISKLSCVALGEMWGSCQAWCKWILKRFILLSCHAPFWNTANSPLLAFRSTFPFLCPSVFLRFFNFFVFFSQYIVVITSLTWTVSTFFQRKEKEHFKLYLSSPLFTQDLPICEGFNSHTQRHNHCKHFSNQTSSAGVI